jgi:hypothetical protein
MVLCMDISNLCKYLSRDFAIDSQQGLYNRLFGPSSRKHLNLARRNVRHSVTLLADVLRRHDRFN